MKRIILTGESRGVGLALLKGLLREGCFVIGLSRSYPQEAIKIREEFPNRYIHFEADLSLPQNIKQLYLEKIKPLGKLYGLINNAGLAYDDIVTNANLEKLDKMFKVNCYSPIMLTKYVIRDMLLNNTKGAIVNITSVSTATGYKGLSMYASTKGGLETFSKGVAREWGPKGIRSNCVAPGFMETEMSKSLSNEQKAKIYNRTSLKKQTDIESVVEATLFLLSEKASSITGTILRVDNGTI